jgi:hypothetical protein
MLAAFLVVASVAVACGGKNEVGVSPAEVEQAFTESGLPLFNTRLFSESDQSVHGIYASFPPEKAGTPIFVVVYDSREKAALSAVPSASPSEDATQVERFENVVVFYGEGDSPVRKHARESALESQRS